MNLAKEIMQLIKSAKNSSFINIEDKKFAVCKFQECDNYDFSGTNLKSPCIDFPAILVDEEGYKYIVNRNGSMSIGYKDIVYCVNNIWVVSCPKEHPQEMIKEFRTIFLLNENTGFENPVGPFFNDGLLTDFTYNHFTVHDNTNIYIFNQNLNCQQFVQESTFNGGHGRIMYAKSYGDFYEKKDGEWVFVSRYGMTSSQTFELPKTVWESGYDDYVLCGDKKFFVDAICNATETKTELGKQLEDFHYIAGRRHTFDLNCISPQYFKDEKVCEFVKNVFLKNTKRSFIVKNIDARIPEHPFMDVHIKGEKYKTFAEEVDKRHNFAVESSSSLADKNINNDKRIK